MFDLKIFALFSCIFLCFSETKFVDTITKCSVEDSNCLSTLITTSLKVTHKTGIPELGIPPLDPLELKDITISYSDLLKFTIAEGKAIGLKNCVVSSYKIEIEKGHTEAQFNCKSLIIEGKYNLSGTSPLFKTTFGADTIHGTGNGKVQADEIGIHIDFYFNVVKNKDGDVTFDCKLNNTRYDYEILGKISFAADNIFLGKKEASQEVVKFMNENSKTVLTTFGTSFFDKALEVLYSHVNKFIQVVPTKYYIIEDLSKYGGNVVVVCHTTFLIRQKMDLGEPLLRNKWKSLVSTYSYSNEE